MRSTIAYGVFASLLALGACGPTITMTDSVDLTWDFLPTLDRFKDDLHTPYVTGAHVLVYVSSDADKPNLAGWTVTSSDPSVFSLGTPTYDGLGLSASGVAGNAGTADLTIYDDKNQVQGSGTVSVMVPDHIELDAHAYLILNMPDDAPIGGARQLQNGEATYLVRYFAGGQELYGNQALTVDAPDGITAEPRTTFFFEDREWLSVTSTQVGTASLTLSAGGNPVSTVPITTVAESDIDQVVLLDEPESGHKDGDWLVALAQAYDTSGNRIFGVDFDWNVAGVEQLGSGDLFRYEYKAGDEQSITATRGTHSDTMDIQTNGVGFVDSSNNIGCSTGGGGGAGALAFVGLLLIRRPRRRDV